jgi:hypothetical protein
MELTAQPDVDVVALAGEHGVIGVLDVWDGLDAVLRRQARSVRGGNWAESFAARAAPMTPESGPSAAVLIAGASGRESIT